MKLLFHKGKYETMAVTQNHWSIDLDNISGQHINMCVSSDSEWTDHKYVVRLLNALSM